MERFGRWRGAALAAMAYGGVHVVTGNFTLLGAAGIAGAHWCALYRPACRWARSSSATSPGTSGSSWSSRQVKWRTVAPLAVTAV